MGAKAIKTEISGRNMFKNLKSIISPSLVVIGSKLTKYSKMAKYHSANIQFRLMQHKAKLIKRFANPKAEKVAKMGDKLTLQKLGFSGVFPEIWAYTAFSNRKSMGMPLTTQVTNVRRLNPPLPLAAFTLMDPVRFSVLFYFYIGPITTIWSPFHDHGALLRIRNIPRLGVAWGGESDVVCAGFVCAVQHLSYEPGELSQ